MTESTRADRAAVSRVLAPRSVAIVGASGVPTRIGGLIVRLLVKHGFPGAVYPINPKYDEIAGLPCYPDLDAIPPDEPIDLAILYLPVDAVPDAARRCGERGVRALVVITSGFAEVDADGAARQAELLAVVRHYGMAMAGPNCAGVANFSADFVAYGTTNFVELDTIIKGPVALVSASGGFGNTVFTYCQERYLGMSHIIGLGNEAATDASEFLDALLDDPAVGIVLANLESIRNPKAFFAAADRAGRNDVPIIALHAGRSAAGRAAIATHTAALGGSPQAIAGAFRQHGIVQVTDLEEFADTALLLSRSPAVRGDRVGIFSLAGGGTGLLSDVAGDHGFTVSELEPSTEATLAEILPDFAVPKNPLDTTAGFARDSERLAAALTTFAADPNIDAVLFFPLAAQIAYADALVTTIIETRPSLTKALIVIWTAGQHLAAGPWRRLHEAGVPLFTSATSALLALRRARTYAEFIESRDDPRSSDLGAHYGQFADVHDVSTASGARRALADFGIDFPSTVLATTSFDASQAVQSFGRSVLKVASPQIAHKTEAGGVRLDICDPDSAALAFDEIMHSAHAYAPAATIDGVEVQQQVDAGLEFLLGVSTDAELGPILTIGAGGVLAELLRDTASRPIPVSRLDVEQMIAELRISALLDGFRGSARLDRAAVVDAALGLSAFADSVRDRGPELDLNPLVVHPDGQGATAVDLVLILQR